MHLFQSIVGIDGTSVLFRKSQFNVGHFVKLMFLFFMGMILFLTSTCS